MNNKIIKKENTLTLIVAALAIVIVTNLKIDGYLKRFILPIIITIISYYHILKEQQIPHNKAFYLLLPIALILISDPLIKIDFSNKVLNLIIMPILLTCLFFMFTNKNFQIADNFLLWFFKIFPNNLCKNLTYLKFNSSGMKDRKTKNIILGILIGGIIGLIILNLLTSADVYFCYFISSILKHVNFNFGNITTFIISFIILFSVLINIIKNQSSKMEKTKKINTDKTLIITILSIINFIFILFIISEISRLTTNFLKLPKEYTYSSYAREGFFQLLFVTLINFSIIFFIEYKTKISDKSSLVKKLSYLLITFSIILIFNSYYRMILYIGNYGLTVLRTQVILFLAMELILFIILVKKIAKGLKHQDALIYFTITISTYIINLYICNKTVISFVMNLINK